MTTASVANPERDMALSEELLKRVGHGEADDLLRVYRPGPTVAFGRLDRVRGGFEQAWRIAEAHGRTPVVRLGGGHAAAYDPDCLVVELIRRHDHQLPGLDDRFAEMTGLIQRACARIGVETLLGELPGEYCPGRYSLHLPGGPKIAGVAQRLTQRSSLTTAVIVVRGADPLQAVIVDIYKALGLALNAETVGAIASHCPEITVDRVATVIVEVAAEVCLLQPPADAGA